jgi:hypothetical protein
MRKQSPDAHDAGAATGTLRPWAVGAVPTDLSALGANDDRKRVERTTEHLGCWKSMKNTWSSRTSRCAPWFSQRDGEESR